VLQLSTTNTGEPKRSGSTSVCSSRGNDDRTCNATFIYQYSPSLFLIEGCPPLRGLFCATCLFNHIAIILAQECQSSQFLNQTTSESLVDELETNLEINRFIRLPTTLFVEVLFKDDEQTLLATRHDFLNHFAIPGQKHLNSLTSSTHTQNHSIAIVLNDIKLFLNTSHFQHNRISSPPPTFQTSIF